jgi:hypothetical protein
MLFFCSLRVVAFQIWCYEFIYLIITAGADFQLVLANRNTFLKRITVFWLKAKK